MSATTLSIDPAAFAEAITELPLSAVFSKVSELRNSIAHLHRSNAEIRSFLEETNDTEEEKKSLEEYIDENKGVIASMEERVLLLKKELENRGQPLVEAEKGEDKKENGAEPNGAGAEAEAQAQAPSREGDEGVYL